MGRAEADISSVSLPYPTPLPIAQTPADTVITTSLSPFAIGRQLRYVPFPSLGAGAERRWRLLPEPDPSAGSATTELTDTGSTRQLRLRCSLNPSGEQLRDLRAAERAYALSRSLLHVLKLADPDVSLTTEGQS